MPRAEFDLGSTREVRARSSWSLQNGDIANRFYPIGLFRVLQAFLFCMVTIVVLLAAAVSPFCENSRMEENMKQLNTVGERIKSLRVEKGMTQEQVARALHFGSRSMVSDYESGRRELPYKSVGDYAGFFKVTAKWIMQGDEEIEEPQSLDEELLRAFHRIQDPRYRRVAIEQIKALANA